MFSGKANVVLPCREGYRTRHKEKGVFFFNSHHEWKTGRRTHCISAPHILAISTIRFRRLATGSSSRSKYVQNVPIAMQHAIIPYPMLEISSSCSFAVSDPVPHNRQIVHLRRTEMHHHYNHISPPSPATHLRHASEYADSKSRTQRRVSKSGLFRRLS